MQKQDGALMGLHFNKFTGGPCRMRIEDGAIIVNGRTHVFSYTGTLTISRKRTEPFFANHWIQMDLPDGPAWLTCSKKRAQDFSEEAEQAGLTVLWT